MTDVIRLVEAFKALEAPWTPMILAQIHGMDLKMARLEGTFVWHQHDDADELFLVVDGDLEIRLRDRTLHLGPGELTVIPRGVEHLPVSEAGCNVLLLERAGTKNTGDADDARTVDAPRHYRPS